MEIEILAIHPRRLKSRGEVEEVLSVLDSLGEADRGVALVQSQFGGSYIAIPRETYDQHNPGEVSVYAGTGQGSILKN